MNRTQLVLAGVAALAACGGDDDPASPLCDAADVRAALARAGAGDIVRLGACSVAGPFVVPAGASLEGEGTAATTVTASEGVVAVELAPGAPPTAVRGLTIVSDGRAGVVARASGAVEITDVRIRATRGIGLGFDGTDVVRLRGVSVSGPVLPDNVLDFTADQGADETALYGLLALSVGDLGLDDVTVEGFAAAGATLVDGVGHWTGVAIERNLGAGLLAYGGAWTLEAVSIAESLDGAQLVPSYGAVFSEGHVDSTDLVVRGGGGYGLVHLGSTAVHTSLIAEGNADAGVFVQDCEAFELVDAALTGNGYAGLVAGRTSGLSVHGGRIDGTRAVTAVVDDAGVAEIGDGLQLLETTEEVNIDGVTFAGNARVGMLLDLGGGSGAGIALEGVVVEGDGEELGAVQQNGDIAAGWDDGVERRGATAANDEEFVTLGLSLAVRGLLGPNDVPAPEDDALRSLLGPND